MTELGWGSARPAQVLAGVYVPRFRTTCGETAASESVDGNSLHTH